MLSINVQLAFNQFALDYASAQNIDIESLLSRLSLVQSDSLANHIMANFKTWRYALAKRELAGLINGLKVYTTWKYYILLSGQTITDILFLPGVNEFFVDDVVKIIGIKPKILDSIIKNLLDIETPEIIKTDNGKKVIDTGYTGDNPINFEKKTVTQTQTAGFEMKNILIIGLVGAAAYMVLK